MFFMFLCSHTQKKLNICLSGDNAEDMANVFWRDYREERSEKADEKVMALV